MENLKTKVNSEAENKEAQELFFELGATMVDGSKSAFLVLNIMGLAVIEGVINFVNGAGFYNTKQCKEITLQELRDMVVLKRNDVGDATHKPSIGYPQYHCSYGGVFQFFENKWNFSHNQLPPIKEDMMKEFLNPEQNYSLVQCCVGKTPIPESWIEVPEGAEILTVIVGDNVFYKSGKPWKWYSQESKKWMECSDIVGLDGFQNVLWQREKESLNNKIATAEAARQQSKNIDATLAERQSQYGSFEDVAFVTENIMATLAKARSNGLQDLPHTHRMALYMIASKMARIVNGDFNHLDGWHDIGGYSKLIEDLIGDNNEI